MADVAGTPTAPDQPSEARERLRQHFLTHPSTSTHPQRWDDLWAAGDFLPWDRGRPNPALEDTLRDRQDLLGEPVTAEWDADGRGGRKRRKRALVPGCGKGYDVLLLAAAGYDAYGVEASKNAVGAAERYAEAAGGEEMYEAWDQGLGKGEVKFLYGDFFQDGWVEGVGGKAEGAFDLIYDYTFLSALPPSLRPAWAARMSQLLAPSGVLICVEFPTYKPPSTGGPPWALPPAVYEAHLSRPGEEVAYNDEGYVDQKPGWNEPSNAAALVRIAHWQPERTHEVGKGTDWVSIWRHKS
ncbi:hypothetical protein H2201_007951 [Coniosporium apollinis]|uniref:S-adenosyl-L-methionine-dependent methyltransferase n=1 Tax=Coniosporium apollinis TaxID=61459 RepID=A0ABQ9NPC8_9PEZI|nr:hypothetical protein H2201_007951 [Coniosporium apollinis]